MKNEFDILNDVTVDFSAYEVKDLNEKELKAMKNVIHNTKKKRAARIGALAACVALVAALSQTAFAKEFIDNIINQISTGHNEFFQYDMENVGVDIPEKLQIFYDENGELATTYQSGDVYYDKDGNKIDNIEGYIRTQVEAGVIKDEDGDDVVTLTFGSDKKTDPVNFYKEHGYSIIETEADMAKLDEALDFTPVQPTELPEGFSFRAAAYFDTSGYYLTLIYTNDSGDEITVNERLINEETAFAYGTDDKIEEVKVNGHKAALVGERSLDWEMGDVSVGICTHGCISRDELLSMAENMQ